MKELNKINWKQNGDKWLAYDENNIQTTGWLHDSNEDRWYYCYSSDIAKGWFKDVDGRWYYFSPCQQVTYNHQYYTGEMMVNWVKIDNKWYYLLPKSIPSEGVYKGQCLIDTTEEIDGVSYSFDKSGAWIENNGVSDKGIDFIASWEGFYSKAYADPYYGANVKDYWTIGFGTCYCSNPSAFPNGLNSTCTREQALTWLKEEADKCYNKIKTDLTNKGIALSNYQMDAISSFSFNCGVNALFGSSLYKYIIQGGTDANKIKTYFRMWNKANGQVSKGLDRRRIAEADMFSYGVYNNN